jgi:hypothetical protein
LAFVDTVDDVKVELGCKAALQQFAEKTCTPPGKTKPSDGGPVGIVNKPGEATPNDPNPPSVPDLAAFGYPFGCAGLAPRAKDSAPDVVKKSTLYGLLLAQAETYCFDPDKKTATDAGLDASAMAALEDVFTEVGGLLQGQLGAVCEDMMRQYNIQAMFDTTGASITNGMVEVAREYLDEVYKGDLLKIVGVGAVVFVEGDSRKTEAYANATGEYKLGWGLCAKRGLADLCRAKWEQMGDPADTTAVGTNDFGTPTCKVSEQWYKYNCEKLADGYWDAAGGKCYTRP